MSEEHRGRTYRDSDYTALIPLSGLLTLVFAWEVLLWNIAEATLSGLFVMLLATWLLSMRAVSRSGTHER